MGTRTILFSPIRLDAATLALTLKSHRALRGLEERWYTDDCTDEEASKLLHKEDAVVSFVSSLPPVKADYRTEVEHDWTGARVSRVAMLRNEAIKQFLATDADFLFITDSDVVLAPNTIEHLVSLNLPIVSPIFWTQWTPNAPYMPQTWDVHPYGHRGAESVIASRCEGKQIEVGGLGACTLIRRDVLEAGIDYNAIPSIDFDGEDRHLCIKASTKGFKLFADTSITPFHVYRASQLDEAAVWYEQGADPLYFKSAWLGEEWEENLRKRETALCAPISHTKKLALCLPGEVFSRAYLTNIIDAYTWLATHVQVAVFYGFSSNASVTRQVLSQAILDDETQFDYVLWIDDDNLFNHEDAKRLLETLETHKAIDLVCGWCSVSRGEIADTEDTLASCGIFDENDRPRFMPISDITEATGLIDIGWTGFPAVLMRGDLLRKLGAKSFSHIPDESSRWGFLGEDVSFSKRARAAGAVMVCDGRVKLPHMKLRDSNNDNQVREVTNA